VINPLAGSVVARHPNANGTSQATAAQTVLAYGFDVVTRAGGRVKPVSERAPAHSGHPLIVTDATAPRNLPAIVVCWPLRE